MQENDSVVQEKIAIAPVGHSVIIDPERFNRLVLKVDTHLYRLKTEPKQNEKGGLNEIFPLEHRFESMTSWTWTATYADVITAIAGTCSQLGLDFGLISDGEAIEATSFLGPPTPRNEANLDEVWFNFSSPGAIFLTDANHLPITFGKNSPHTAQWGVSHHKGSSGYAISTREDLDEDWEIADVVTGDPTEAAKTVCELAEIPFASPPTYSNIRTVWEENQDEANIDEIHQSQYN